MKPVRRAARVLVLTPVKQFVLFHFVHTSGPLAGTDYWGVPGGGVEEGESLEEAGLRELREETGISVDRLGPVVARADYDFRLSDGREVRAEDSYFLLRVDTIPVLSRSRLTPEEAINMATHKWWTLEELEVTGENITPANLATLLQPILR